MGLPFAIATRPWELVPERERTPICFEDEFKELPPNHAAQIRMVDPKDSEILQTWAFAAIPSGWPDHESGYEFEEKLGVGDCWNDPSRIAGVQDWLYRRGVPFQRTVYLLYERDNTVETSWKIVVRYWDSFARSVGYAMIAVDHTLQWACCFHHEDVIVFGSHALRIE
jgi:hypothetical protein